MALATESKQQPIAEKLRQVVKQRRVSHAYIFAGPRGVGKTQAAVSFAMALNCLDEVAPETGEACGKCHNCLRIANSNHPDVLVIEPDGKSIKIDQIRQTQKDIGFKAVDARYKLFIIREAEALTDQAANSLLKLLEEPGNNMASILLVENYQQLLPTIRSRAQLFSFQPQEPFAMLEASVEDGAELIAGLRNIVLEWTEEIASRRYAAVHRVANQLNKDQELKDNIKLVLDMLLLWYRDVLNIKLGRVRIAESAELSYKEQFTELKKQSGQLSEEDLLLLLERIIEIKKRLDYNVNLQLLLEQMIFSLWEGR